MAEKIKVLISEEEVDARIRELGEKISKEYEGKQIHLICVLTVSYTHLCTSYPSCGTLLSTAGFPD